MKIKTWSGLVNLSDIISNTLISFEHPNMPIEGSAKCTDIPTAHFSTQSASNYWTSPVFLAQSVKSGYPSIGPKSLLIWS
jgi:hypothetical protein